MIRAALCLLAALAWLPASAQGPRDIEHKGPFTQQASGALFRERVGDFVRTRITQYDEAGDDVSGSYNLVTPEGRLVLTVYVYPGPTVPPKTPMSSKVAACGEYFESARAEIAKKPGARTLKEEESVAVGEIDPKLRKRVLFAARTRFDGEEQDVRTQLDLYCFVGGKWMVKYRTTSHAAFDATAAIDTFIRTGPWPSGEDSTTD